MKWFLSILEVMFKSITSSFLVALRKRRRDEELKKAAQDEIKLEAEKVRNNALKKWEKLNMSVNRVDIINKLRKGKF